MPWLEPDAEIREIQVWFGRRGKELFIKPHGIGYHAVVMEAGTESGEARVYYADSELDAARLALRSYARERLSGALHAVGQIAQSQVGQLVIAEVALARVPLMRHRYARQVAIGAAIWMADERNRRAIRAVAGAAADVASVSRRTHRAQEIASSSRRAIRPAVELLGEAAVEIRSRTRREPPGI
jgi:hypothetical protein